MDRTRRATWLLFDDEDFQSLLFTPPPTVIISIPGIELVLPYDRLHYELTSDRLHYEVPEEV